MIRGACHKPATIVVRWPMARTSSTLTWAPACRIGSRYCAMSSSGAIVSRRELDEDEAAAIETSEPRPLEVGPFRFEPGQRPAAQHMLPPGPVQPPHALGDVRAHDENAPQR